MAGIIERSVVSTNWRWSTGSARPTLNLPTTSFSSRGNCFSSRESSSAFGKSRQFKRNGVPRADAGVAGVAANLRKVKQTKPIVMVDPVEAKRLAALEMKALEAGKKLRRRREIEAVNGGWAVLGLTAGLVIDGYTGKSILNQVAGYLNWVADFISTITPS